MVRGVKWVKKCGKIEKNVVKNLSNGHKMWYNCVAQKIKGDNDMAKDNYNKAKAGQRSKESLGAMWANIKSKGDSDGGKVVKKELSKKTYQPLIISVVICLVVGALIGYFALGFFTKNDCFVMNEYSTNEVDVYIGGDSGVDEYVEKGAKCVAFGKEITDDIVVTYKFREDLSMDAISVNDVDETKSGIYYAIYTIDNIRYKGIELVRNIIVMGQEV